MGNKQRKLEIPTQEGQYISLGGIILIPLMDLTCGRRTNKQKDRGTRMICKKIHLNKIQQVELES